MERKYNESTITISADVITIKAESIRFGNLVVKNPSKGK